MYSLRASAPAPHNEKILGAGLPSDYKFGINKFIFP